MQRPARLRPRDFTFRCAQPGSGRTPRSMIPMELRRRRRRCNGSVCEMGPWSGRLLEYAAYLVGNCSKLCLSVDQLFSNLHYLRSIEGHCRVNHDKSGTDSAANGCMVLVDLFLCNEFLWVIAFELPEVSPGRLTLACLRGRVVHVAPNMQRRPSPLAAQGTPLHRDHGTARLGRPAKPLPDPGRLLAEPQPGAREAVQLPSERLPTQGPDGRAPLNGGRARHAGDRKRALPERRCAHAVQAARLVRSSDCLREYAAHLVDSCPSLCPSVNQLFSNLRYLRSIPIQSRVNYDQSRTASMDNGCILLAVLSLWNEFLWAINFELYAKSVQAG